MIQVWESNTQELSFNYLWRLWIDQLRGACVFKNYEDKLIFQRYAFFLRIFFFLERRKEDFPWLDLLSNPVKSLLPHLHIPPNLDVNLAYQISGNFLKITFKVLLRIGSGISDKNLHYSLSLYNPESFLHNSAL